MPHARSTRPTAGLALSVGSASPIAPFSRFGLWLDAFVPTMKGARLALVVMTFDAAALLLVLAARHAL